MTAEEVREEFRDDQGTRMALTDEAFADVESRLGMGPGTLIREIHVPDSVWRLIDQAMTEAFDREATRRTALETRDDYWRDWR